MMFCFVLFNADVDECSLAAVTGLQACQDDALCRNTPGSFTCSCPTGYIMAPNGQSCVGEGGVNGGGGGGGDRLWVLYRVRGDGSWSSFSSTDIDECVVEQRCRPEFGNICVNTPGSFVCRCQPGFRAETPACVGEPGFHLHHSSPRSLRILCFTPGLAPLLIRSCVSSFHSVSRYEELMTSPGLLLCSY